MALCVCLYVRKQRRHFLTFRHQIWHGGPLTPRSALDAKKIGAGCLLGTFLGVFLGGVHDSGQLKLSRILRPQEGLPEKSAFSKSCGKYAQMVGQIRSDWGFGHPGALWWPKTERAPKKICLQKVVRSKKFPKWELLPTSRDEREREG